VASLHQTEDFISDISREAPVTDRKTAAPTLPAPAPELKPPGKRQREVIAESAERTRARRLRPHLKVTKTSETLVTIGPTHSDIDGYTSELNDTFGTASTDFKMRQLKIYMAALWRDTKAPDEDGLNSMLAAVSGVRPAGRRRSGDCGACVGPPHHSATAKQ
jgi:hypothetical protein